MNGADSFIQGKLLTCDARDEAPSALLPGIGGMGSRLGRMELHLIGEFIGVILIWIGCKYCQRPLDTINM
jgi:hypothetical protein